MALVAPSASLASLAANQRDVDRLARAAGQVLALPVATPQPGLESSTAPGADNPQQLGKSNPKRSAQPGDSRLVRTPPRQSVVSCRRSKTRRVCTRYDSAHRAVQRCTYIPATSHRARCVRLRTRAAALNWQGFLATPLPAVGKILFERGDGRPNVCSGTLVAPTLVLTAGHCLYDTATASYARRVWFAPGASYGSGAAFSVHAAHGWWKARRFWVSPSWQASADAATDWALVDLAPEDGAYAGARAGYWPVVTGLGWRPGTRTYLVGYPTTGIFSSVGYGGGATQYACDSTYTGWTTLGSGPMLWSPCTMTQGASGGAWFAYYNGQWQIAGIIDRCTAAPTSPNCAPFSSMNGSPLLGAGFLSFWNSVVAQIAAGQT